ncbi:MAG: hypothetical protein C0624_10060 [Desulfuromonas sp.]|nr:MAG: hypothetical protein C0624_10060 [Desulfuromonas sp.]
MPETILLTYSLSKELWRRFFEAHYGCEKSLTQRYLWGVVCIVIACLGFGGFYANISIASLLMATGLFGVLSKPLLVIRSLRTARKHPFYGAELSVAISPGELSVRSENAGYSQPWDNFAGYRKLEPGFLLYHDQHAFFFIPLEAMTAGDATRIVEILAAAEVADLGRNDA